MLGGTVAHGRQQHGGRGGASGNGLLSCPGCGGRLGGWGHAVPRRVFTAGRVPVSGAAAAGAVRFVPGDACSSSGVAAGAAVRRDGGDRGHARAGGAGAGVPVDRGGVGGAGGHGAGPAAPVPRLGGPGAGVLHPAGRGAWRWIRCRWTRRAAPLGDAVVAVAAAAAAAAGRWPGAHGVGLGAGGRGHDGVASVPVCRLPAGFAGMCRRLPWRDGSTRVPLCPGAVTSCHSRRACGGRQPRRDKT